MSRNPSSAPYLALIAIGFGTVIVGNAIGLNFVIRMVLVVCVTVVYLSLYTAITERD